MRKEILEQKSYERKNVSAHVVQGLKEPAAQQKASPQQITKDVPIDLGAEAVSALLELSAKGLSEAALRTACRNVGKNVAYGLFEGNREPAFVTNWELRAGKLYLCGQPLQELLFPSQSKLAEYEAKGLSYAPMPADSAQALLHAERELNNGAGCVSLVTPGCNGTNYVQVLVRDSTSANGGSSYHIEHVGEPGDLGELRRFEEQILKSLGFHSALMAETLDKATVQIGQAGPLDWKSLAEEVRRSVGGKPGPHKDDWAKRLQDYSLNADGRRALLEQLSSRVEEVLMKKLLPHLSNPRFADDLESAVIGSRTEAERILKEELSGRFLGQVRENWRHAKAGSKALAQGLIPERRGAEPDLHSAWQEVAALPQVRLSCRGVRAQLMERKDLASSGLIENLDALLLSGGVSQGIAVDVSKAAELCRTVACYTHDPELSRDLYTLADTLEKEVKRAWRAVRSGDLPPRSIQTSDQAGSPKEQELILLTQGPESRRNSHFSPEMQELLDSMAAEHERRAKERQRKEIYRTYLTLAGRASPNPLLSALRHAAPVEDELLAILSDNSVNEEIKKIAVETRQAISDSSDLKPVQLRIVEPEERPLNLDLRSRREELLRKLESQLDDKGEKAQEVRLKWLPLKETDVFDAALIVEFIEILELGAEERASLLTAAGLDQSQLTLIERIEKQLVIERKFRLLESNFSGRAA